MQHHHALLTINIEKQADDPVARQARAYLMQSVAHGTTGRHSDRPTVLDRLDVLSDPPPILHVHSLQPFAHGLLTGRGAEKDSRNAFHRGKALSVLYHRRYTSSSVFASLSPRACSILPAHRAAPMLTRRHIIRTGLGSL